MGNERGILLIETLFAAAILSIGIVSLAAAIHRSRATQADDIARARAGEILEERASAIWGGDPVDTPLDLMDPVLGPACLVTRAVPQDPNSRTEADRKISWREIVLTWRRHDRPDSLSVVVARPA